MNVKKSTNVRKKLNLSTRVLRRAKGVNITFRLPKDTKIISTKPSVSKDGFDLYYDSLSPQKKKLLGEKISNVIYTTIDRLGKYKKYTNGIILFHSNYGKIVLYGIIFKKWKNMNADRGVLGCPVSSIFISRGREYALFEKGIIYGGKVAYEVHGEIYQHYCRLGREKGFLGFPVGDVKDTKVRIGRYCDFQHGSIYWSPSTGAFEVHGSIRAKWLKLGGPKSFLGYPLSDELPIEKTPGRFNRFKGGVIYWHPKYGAHEVHGAIRKKWEELGGVKGWLGFPLTDESQSPKKKVRHNDFENGIIVWNSKKGAIAIKELHFYLDRFGSKGSDRWGLGGGQDVYVHVKIATNEKQEFKARMPRKGNFGSGKEIDKTLLKIRKVNHKTWIYVYFKGMDEDDWNADDHLGTVEKKYTIDEFWGIFDKPEHWNRDFQVVYSIKNIVPLSPDEPFRHQLWWPFDNFSTSKLSKMQYAQTFRDVDPQEKWWLHPFNALYYETAYKGVASKGNCFGMCLEAIYALVGRSVFSEPIYQWGPEGREPYKPDYAHIIEEINIKHGYQLGASCIDWVVGRFLIGNTHNPKKVFYNSRKEFNRGNYPILVVTPSYFKLGAHAVLPYWYQEVKNTKDKLVKLRIYIADPNVEWKGPRAKKNGKIQAHPTFIDINPSQNIFRYWHTQTEVWTGGEWTGGRLYYIPFSKLSFQPRTPFWEIFSLLLAGTILIIAGDADSEQIKDEKGRTFFKTNLGRIPCKYEDINYSNNRIPNMVKIPLIDFKGIVPEIYFRKGVKRGKLLHRIVGRGGGGYRYLMKAPTISTYAHIPIGKRELDVITNENLSLPNQSLQIQTKGKTRKITIGIHTYFALQKDDCKIELTNVPLIKDRPVKIQLDEKKEVVFLENKGQDAKIELRVETRIGGRIKMKTIRNIPIRAGKVLKIKPKNWSSLGGKLKFEVLDRIKGPTIHSFKL